MSKFSKINKIFNLVLIGMVLIFGSLGQISLKVNAQQFNETVFGSCNAEESDNPSAIGDCVREILTFLIVVGLIIAVFRFAAKALSAEIPGHEINSSEELRKTLYGIAIGMLLIGAPVVILSLFNESALTLNFLDGLQRGSSDNDSSGNGGSQNGGGGSSNDSGKTSSGRGGSDNGVGSNDPGGTTNNNSSRVTNGGTDGNTDTSQENGEGGLLNQLVVCADPDKCTEIITTKPGNFYPTSLISQTDATDWSVLKKDGRYKDCQDVYMIKGYALNEQNNKENITGFTVYCPNTKEYSDLYTQFITSGQIPERPIDIGIEIFPT